MKSLLLSLVWILFSSSLVFGEILPAKEQRNKWPTCIAQFCFDQHAPKERFLTQIYGSGALKNEGEESFHCYEAVNQKLFLKFTIHNDTPLLIVSILVSDKPLCAEAKRPIKPFGQLKTLEGLMVGDKYEKAIQLYGFPQYVRIGKELDELIRDEFFASSQEMGFDKAVAYGPNKTDDLLVTWLFLRNDKIVAILMSISE